MIQSPLYDKHIQTFQEFMQNYTIVAPKLKQVQERRMKK